MSDIRRQVERFYGDLWNRRDKAVIPDLLHEDVSFRGSLGEETTGHAGFAGYLERIHEALGSYQCVIEDLVVEGPKAFARMTFSGIHRNDFMGFRPSGRRVTWRGCALFTFRGARVKEIWVLGDLKALEAQLEANAAGRAAEP